MSMCKIPTGLERNKTKEHMYIAFFKMNDSLYSTYYNTYHHNNEMAK